LPIAERNRLLLAGGFAPPYLEQPYDGEVMRPLRESLSRLLKAYEPNPALIVDGLWNLIAQGGADRTRCGDPASLHTTRVGMVTIELDDADRVERSIEILRERYEHAVALRDARAQGR
jgi:non-ribosomal peptide synthetase component F